MQHAIKKLTLLNIVLRNGKKLPVSYYYARVFIDYFDKKIVRIMSRKTYNLLILKYLHLFNS